MNKGDLSEFKQFPYPNFPNAAQAVYDIAVKCGENLRPIVGKTETSLRARMGHYCAASKHTAADLLSERRLHGCKRWAGKWSCVTVNQITPIEMKARIARSL